VSLHAQFKNEINYGFRSIVYGSNFTYVVSAEVPVPVQQVLSNSRNQPQPESKAPEPLMIACMALLLCNNAVCDRDMFAAIVDSGLVFDGGLVVGTVSDGSGTLSIGWMSLDRVAFVHVSTYEMYSISC
jgi:hypothetical protein